MPDYLKPFPGTPRTVERADGTRIHTVSTGTGPATVVFAHGYGANMDEWNVVSDALPERRQIAFDLRAHGQSTLGCDGVDPSVMAEDYVAVLEAHDVRNAVLVGHSTGGFLAIRILLNHPDVARERIRGCVLVATFAGDVLRDNFQNRIQIPLIQSGLLVGGLRWRPVARAFARSLAGDDFREAYAEPLARAFRAADHKALVPLLRALGAESDYPRLPEIDLPCTILVGAKDHTTPTFHADDMHAGIRGSTLRRLEGKGHLLNWEAPEVIVEAIRAM